MCEVLKFNCFVDPKYNFVLPLSFRCVTGNSWIHILGTCLILFVLIVVGNVHLYSTVNCICCLSGSICYRIGCCSAYTTAQAHTHRLLSAAIQLHVVA